MTYITALDPPTFHQVDRRQIPPLISYLLPRQLRKETTTRLYIEGLTECGYFRDLTGISWLILMNLCDLESYVLVQFVFVPETLGLGVGLGVVLQNCFFKHTSDKLT